MAKLTQYFKDRLRISLENACTTHKDGLGSRDGIWRLLIALGLLAVFGLQTLASDPKFSLSFFFAGFVAIYSGLIYKARNVMILILVGVVIGALVNTVFFAVLESFSKGECFGGMCLIVIGIVLFGWSSSLKRGDKPEGWEDTTEKTKQKARRRTSRKGGK